MRLTTWILLVALAVTVCGGGEAAFVRGTFTITNRPFEEEYADPSSEAFRRLATSLESELNTLFRSSNLSAIYNTSMVLRLRPAPPPQGARNNGTAVEVLLQLTQSPPHAVSTVTTNFIQGMHNAHRHLWLGNFTVKLDHILFTAVSGGAPTKPIAGDHPAFKSSAHSDQQHQDQTHVPALFSSMEGPDTEQQWVNTESSTGLATEMNQQEQYPLMPVDRRWDFGAAQTPVQPERELSQDIESHWEESDRANRAIRPLESDLQDSAPARSRYPHPLLEEFFLWMPSGDAQLEEWSGDDVMWLLTTTVTRTRVVPSTVVVTRAVEPTPVVVTRPVTTPVLAMSTASMVSRGGQQVRSTTVDWDLVRSSYEYPGPSVTVAGSSLVEPPMTTSDYSTNCVSTTDISKGISPVKPTSVSHSSGVATVQPDNLSTTETDSNINQWDEGSLENGTAKHPVLGDDKIQQGNTSAAKASQPAATDDRNEDDVTFKKVVTIPPNTQSSTSTPSFSYHETNLINTRFTSGEHSSTTSPTAYGNEAGDIEQNTHINDSNPSSMGTSAAVSPPNLTTLNPLDPSTGATMGDGNNISTTADGLVQPVPGGSTDSATTGADIDSRGSPFPDGSGGGATSPALSMESTTAAVMTDTVTGQAEAPQPLTDIPQHATGDSVTFVAVTEGSPVTFADDASAKTDAVQTTGVDSDVSDYPSTTDDFPGKYSSSTTDGELADESSADEINGYYEPSESSYGWDSDAATLASSTSSGDSFTDDYSYSTDSGFRATESSILGENEDTSSSFYPTESSAVDKDLQIPYSETSSLTTTSDGLSHATEESTDLHSDNKLIGVSQTTTQPLIQDNVTGAERRDRTENATSTEEQTATVATSELPDLDLSSAASASSTESAAMVSNAITEQSQNSTESSTAEQSSYTESSAHDVAFSSLPSFKPVTLSEFERELLSSTETSSDPTGLPVPSTSAKSLETVATTDETIFDDRLTEVDTVTPDISTTADYAHDQLAPDGVIPSAHTSLDSTAATPPGLSSAQVNQPSTPAPLTSGVRPDDVTIRPRDGVTSVTPEEGGVGVTAPTAAGEGDGVTRLMEANWSNELTTASSDYDPYSPEMSTSEYSSDYDDFSSPFPRYSDDSIDTDTSTMLTTVNDESQRDQQITTSMISYTGSSEYSSSPERATSQSTPATAVSRGDVAEMSTGSTTAHQSGGKGITGDAATPILTEMPPSTINPDVSTSIFDVADIGDTDQPVDRPEITSFSIQGTEIPPSKNTRSDKGDTAEITETSLRDTPTEKFDDVFLQTPASVTERSATAGARIGATTLLPEVTDDGHLTEADIKSTHQTSSPVRTSSEDALTELFDTIHILPEDIVNSERVRNEATEPALEENTFEIQLAKNSDPSMISSPSTPSSMMTDVVTTSTKTQKSEFVTQQPPNASAHQQQQHTASHTTPSLPTAPPSTTSSTEIHSSSSATATDLSFSSDAGGVYIVPTSKPPHSHEHTHGTHHHHHPHDHISHEHHSSTSTEPEAMDLGDTSTACPPCRQTALPVPTDGVATVAGVPGAQISNDTFKRSVPEPEYWIVTVLRYTPGKVDAEFVKDVEKRLSEAFTDAYKKYLNRRARREAVSLPHGQHKYLIKRIKRASQHQGKTKPGLAETVQLFKIAEKRTIVSPTTSPGPVSTSLVPPPGTAALSRFTAALRRVRRAQEGTDPVQVYVHNVSVKNNRTKFIYTAWRDGEPQRAVDAVKVFNRAVDDREMSVRMGHVVVLTEEYLQPQPSEAQPYWIIAVIIALLILLIFLLWLICCCWKRHKRRAKDEMDAGVGVENRRRVFEEEGLENEGFIHGEGEIKPSGSARSATALTTAASCQTSPEATPPTDRLIKVKAGRQGRYVLQASEEDSEPDDSLYASLGLRASVSARHGSDRSLTPINEPTSAETQPPPPPPPAPRPGSRPSSAVAPAPAPAPPAVAGPVRALPRVPAGRRPASASAAQPSVHTAHPRAVAPYRSTYPTLGNVGGGGGRGGYAGGEDDASRLFTCRVPPRALPLPLEGVGWRADSPAPDVPPRRYYCDRRRRRGGDDVTVRVEKETMEIVSGSGTESEEEDWAEPRRSSDPADQASKADLGRMRRRFHTLLDDAFNSLDGEKGRQWRCRSATGSRNRSQEGPELARSSPPPRPASVLEHRSVPTQVSLSALSPAHKSTWTTTDDLLPPPLDLRSPQVTPGGAVAGLSSPSLQLLTGRTGIEATPIPPRPLLALDADSGLSADDPAVPLIRAIKDELKRFGQTVPTDFSDV